MNQRPSGERETILSVKDQTVGFGDKIVLDKLNLDIYRGEILGFVGASGAGKSVLMRTILGLQEPSAGQIEVFGIDARSTDPQQRREIERHMARAWLVVDKADMRRAETNGGIDRFGRRQSADLGFDGHGPTITGR